MGALGPLLGAIPATRGPCGVLKACGGYIMGLLGLSWLKGPEL